MVAEQHVIRSESGSHERAVWLLRGPGNVPHRLCVVLDAEFYLEHVDCVPVLRGLIGSGAISPMTCVFVSHRSMEARHEDFLCDPGYASFIAKDVVRWATDRAAVTETGNLICGLSLSGLASAHIAMTHPGVFEHCLSQSGSFWWLAANEVSLPRAGVKMWLSVGDQETDAGVSHPPTGLFQEISQIAGVEAAVRRFEALGATVKYNLYAGEHGWSAWRAELEPALKWLVGSAT